MQKDSYNSFSTPGFELPENIESLNKHASQKELDEMKREQRQRQRDFGRKMESDIDKDLFDEVSPKSRKAKKSRKVKKLLGRENKVKIYLRIRPPRSEYTFINKIAKDKLSIQINKDFELKAFGFDKIISPKEKQLKAFAVTCSDVLKGILQGYNGCLIAYGQTGSGKTYTILGDQSKNVKGLLQLSLAYLLASQKEIWLEMSAVQIYMENLYDIFEGEDSQQTSKRKGKSQVKQSMKFSNRTATQNLFSHMKKVKYSYVSKNGMRLHDLLTFKIESIEDVEEIIYLVERNRRTEKTKMNDKSSRSHAVFMVKVHNPEFSGYSTFYLVDLAGSERIKKSQIRDKVTLDETISINSSLMALSNCISTLVKWNNLSRKKKAKSKSRKSGESPTISVSPTNSDNTVITHIRKLNLTGTLPETQSVVTKIDKKKHIPFRESKLTMLLQNCLLGKSMLGLIVTISPDDKDVDESFSTLKFGQCAAKMEIKPMKNEEIEKEQKQSELEKKKESRRKKSSRDKPRRKNKDRHKKNQSQSSGIDAIQSEMEQLDREMNMNIQRNLSKNLKSLDASEDRNIFKMEKQPDSPDETNLRSSSSRREELISQLVMEPPTVDQQENSSPSNTDLDQPVYQANFTNDNSNQANLNNQISEGFNFDPGMVNKDEEHFERYEQEIRKRRQRGESLESISHSKEVPYKEGNNSNFTFQQQDTCGSIGNSSLQNSLYQNITHNVMGENNLGTSEADLVNENRKVVDSEIVESNVLGSNMLETSGGIPASISLLINSLKDTGNGQEKIQQIVNELTK